jgi:hypothetical protein
MSWKPLHGWWDALSDWGWIIPTVGWAVTVVVLMFGLPEAGVDTNPTKSDPKFDIVAATGFESFPVEEFCNDPDTRVAAPFEVPDSSAKTYQLIRDRNGIVETVVVVASDDNIVAATHYSDTSTSQRSQPASVSDQALKCIKGKAP